MKRNAENTNVKQVIFGYVSRKYHRMSTKIPNIIHADQIT